MGAVIAVGLAACSDDPKALSDDEAYRACDLIAVVTDNRLNDATNPESIEAIEALVAALPERLRDEAALYYYPYGGSVEGLDTSGMSADEAGQQLQSVYERSC